MRNERTKNKQEPVKPTPVKKSNVKELPPDLKKALDQIEKEEKKRDEM